jgi:hypothetical protein
MTSPNESGSYRIEAEALIADLRARLSHAEAERDAALTAASVNRALAPKRASEIAIEVYRTTHGHWKLALTTKRPNGVESGYRLAGSKFDGTEQVIFRHLVSERDASQIAYWLEGLA